jgi:hypothetical protein
MDKYFEDDNGKFETETNVQILFSCWNVLYPNSVVLTWLPDVVLL